MNRDQALSKIKKCLELAKSSNPHEAAAAMRQAQKLMAEHGVTETDAQLSDVSAKLCSTRTKSQPLWEARLANAIADAFGCSTIWLRSDKLLPSLRWVREHQLGFIGVGAAPEIAGYAWDVLSRQCAKSRLEHIRAQPARCKPITLTARGDEFARGWVYGVREKIERLAGTERNDLLIEQYKSARWPDSTTFTAKNRASGRNVSHNDLHRGIHAGAQVELNRGVGGVAQQGLLT